MLGLLIWLLPVVVFVLFAVRQRSRDDLSQDSAERALEIHKERLAALLAQKESGELSPEEYQSFKLEEEKALLADAEHQQQHLAQKSQLPWLWVPVLTVLVFGVAWLTYANIGAADAVKVREQFKALSMTNDVNSEQVAETLNGYKNLLVSKPDDIEGWFRLSRMQLDLQQYEDAIDSLEHVLEQLRLVEHNAEDEAAILAYIGQANVSLERPELALAAFEESLQYYQNDTALGLAGRMSFDLGDYKKAIDYWTRLKLKNPQADPAIIDDFINRAKQQLASQGIDYEAEQPAHIIVSVQLPAAWEGLSQDAALFIYARPIGQRMPLAVKRLPVTGQTMTVMLSDQDAMGPMGGISTQEQVEVTARISLTGLANTQPGDWEGDVVQVSIDSKEMFADVVISQP